VTDQTDPYVTDDVHEDDEISDRKLVSRILIVTILWTTAEIRQSIGGTLRLLLLLTPMIVASG
jgi:hypothetical protein